MDGEEDFDGGGYEGGGDDTPEPEDKTRSVPTCIRNNHLIFLALHVNAFRRSVVVQFD
jgi:hypothetical protein